MDGTVKWLKVEAEQNSTRNTLWKFSTKGEENMPNMHFSITWNVWPKFKPLNLSKQVNQKLSGPLQELVGISPWPVLGRRSV